MIDIVVGSKYKVDAANARGWYEVVTINLLPDGTIKSVECRGKDPFIRTFKPEQLVKEQVVKGRGVKGKQLEQIAEIKGKPVFAFEVTEWPQERRRGRPRKNAEPS